MKEIEDHEYDGIKELDNPLPRWWLNTFYITIIFSALYFLGYELMGSFSIRKEFSEELAELEASRAIIQSQQAPQLSEEDFIKLTRSADSVSSGKVTFLSKCATCHGKNGEGGIGPNLTDSYWIHGEGQLTDIRKIVENGVSAKGMPPWKGLLQRQELDQVTAFIGTLQGTRPSGAKKPEGEKK